MKFLDEEDAQLLMSEALKNKLSDEDLSGFVDKFIIVDLSILVGDAIESVNASLFGCKFSEENIELELKVIYEDAFGLSEAWSMIKIAEFSFFLGEERIQHTGPFKINSFGIKNLVPEQRMCVIALHMNRG
jgi:hypothetical protein